MIKIIFKSFNIYFTILVSKCKDLIKQYDSLKNNSFFWELIYALKSTCWEMIYYIILILIFIIYIIFLICSTFKKGYCFAVSNFESFQGVERLEPSAPEIPEEMQHLQSTTPEGLRIYPNLVSFQQDQTNLDINRLTDDELNALLEVNSALNSKFKSD